MEWSDTQTQPLRASLPSASIAEVKITRDDQHTGTDRTASQVHLRNQPSAYGIARLEYLFHDNLPDWRSSNRHVPGTYGNVIAYKGAILETPLQALNRNELEENYHVHQRQRAVKASLAALKDRPQPVATVRAGVPAHIHTAGRTKERQALKGDANGRYSAVSNHKTHQAHACGLCPASPQSMSRLRRVQGIDNLRSKVNYDNSSTSCQGVVYDRSCEGLAPAC